MSEGKGEGEGEGKGKVPRARGGSKRVDNGKMKRLLQAQGMELLHSDYRRRVTTPQGEARVLIS